MFVDSHAHIDGEEFEEDRAEVVERAREAGVCAILNVGTGDPHSGSLERAVEVAERYENVFAAVGIHPHDARLFDERASHRIHSLIEQSPRVIAWGEIGLDYHYDNSPRDVQRNVFRRQLQLARERRLPAVIHTREAEADTLAILNEEWRDAGLPGIIHCFTGTREFAEAAVGLGFCISFSGVVTFKKSEDLRETARHLPMD